MACGCGSKRLPAVKPGSTLSSSGNFSQQSLAEIEASPTSQMVALEYVGANMGTFSLRSKAARDITYRFGNNASHRIGNVLLQDAEIFLGMNERGNPMFRIIQSGGVAGANDPTEFIGQPITA